MLAGGVGGVLDCVESFGACLFAFLLSREFGGAWWDVVVVVGVGVGGGERGWCLFGWLLACWYVCFVCCCWRRSFCGMLLLSTSWALLPVPSLV